MVYAFGRGSEAVTKNKFKVLDSFLSESIWKFEVSPLNEFLFTLRANFVNEIRLKKMKRNSCACKKRPSV